MHPTHRGGAAEEHEAPDPTPDEGTVTDGEGQRDVRAEGVTDDHDVAEVQPFEHLARVGGEARPARGSAPEGGGAVTAQVEGEHAVPGLDEVRHDGPPVPPVAGVAVHEQHRRALAPLDDVQPRPVRGDHLVHCRWLRRR